MPFSGGKSKKNLTEADKEARRIRRILANRESARQTIRRRQAQCEELTRKAADLAWDNENMKREKELVMKEYQSLKDTNNQLKAQIAKTIKAEEEETPKESVSTYVETPPTPSPSSKLPLLVYNSPSFTPFLWPPFVQPLSHVQAQLAPKHTITSKDLMSTTCKPNSSHGPGNPPSINGLVPPFYILPCPWFFPLPDHQNGFYPHPMDSCALRDSRDDTSVDNHSQKNTSVDNQQDEGSSSKVTESVQTHHQCLSRKVKTDASSFEETNPTNNLPETSTEFPHPKGMILMPTPLRSVKPSLNVDCENGHGADSGSKDEAVLSTANNVGKSFSEKMQGPSVYQNQKLVDAAAAAEARKRRKELTKLKNLQSRQLRMHC